MLGSPRSLCYSDSSVPVSKLFHTYVTRRMPIDVSFVILPADAGWKGVALRTEKVARVPHRPVDPIWLCLA